MRAMAHTLRHRLGHPLETTLDLFASRWRPDFLSDLKQRLLAYAEIRNGFSRSDREEERASPPAQCSGSRQSSVETGIDSGHLSREAGHIMQLYVIGHGIAVEVGEGTPDEWRPLSDKGRRRFQKVARAFGKSCRKLDLILTSPLVRAVQTAEILAGETRHREVVVLGELDPKFDAAAARRAIATRAGDAAAVAIVGDAPQLASILATLSAIPEEQIELEDGTIVRVDIDSLTDGASANPRWWLKPKGSRKKGLPLRKAAADRLVGEEAAQARRAAKISRHGKKTPEESRHLPEIAD